MSWKKIQKRRAKQFRKLKPVTLEEVLKRAEEYDAKYLSVMVHSLERHEPERCDELVEEFLSERNRAAFHSTNPHSKRIWMAELLQEFLRIQEQYGRTWKKALAGKVACALVTLTQKEWACVETSIAFDLDRAKQKVRNALAGTNFIAHFEAAPYQNEHWEADGVEGKLICFHCHAIAWSGSRSDLDRLRKYVRPRFEPILQNYTGARFDRLKDEVDLISSLAYIAKTPYLGKRTIRRQNGKIDQKDTSKIAKSSRVRLFHEMKKHSLFDYWLSGGEGTAALRAAKNSAHESARRKRHGRAGLIKVPHASRRGFFRQSAIGR